jgi:hypothetical protein
MTYILVVDSERTLQRHKADSRAAHYLELVRKIVMAGGSATGRVVSARLITQSHVMKTHFSRRHQYLGRRSVVEVILLTDMQQTRNVGSLWKPCDEVAVVLKPFINNIPPFHLAICIPGMGSISAT